MSATIPNLRNPGAKSPLLSAPPLCSSFSRPVCMAHSYNWNYVVLNWLLPSTLFCKFLQCYVVIKIKTMKFTWHIARLVDIKMCTKLMFVDPFILLQFIKKNPTRYENVSNFYYSIFIWSSICFGRHIARH
jgi:hypothetical protein